MECIYCVVAFCGSTFHWMVASRDDSIRPSVAQFSEALSDPPVSVSESNDSFDSALHLQLPCRSQNTESKQSLKMKKI
jgi:hypothetical protein